MIIARNRAAFQQTVMCQTCERPKVSTYRKCLDLRGERLLLFPRSNQTAYSFMNTFWMFTSVWHLKTSLATRKLWCLCYIFYSQTQSRFRFLPLPFVFKFRLALQNRVERRGGCYIPLRNGTTLQYAPPHSSSAVVNGVYVNRCERSDVSSCGDVFGNPDAIAIHLPFIWRT